MPVIRAVRLLMQNLFPSRLYLTCRRVPRSKLRHYGAVPSDIAAAEVNPLRRCDDVVVNGLKSGPWLREAPHVFWPLMLTRRPDQYRIARALHRILLGRIGFVSQETRDALS